MAMTQLGLIFLGSLAGVATGGLLLNFDDLTRTIIAFVASVLWAFFGISSYDVIVSESYAHTQSEPIMVFVLLGIGFALMVGLYGIYSLFQVFSSGVDTSSAGGLMER